MANRPGLVLAARAVLVATIFYDTYQSHFTVDLGIKGLNLTTLLFVAAVAVAVLIGNESKSRTPLRGSFFLFFWALGWAFIVGQLRGNGTILDDLTVVKNVMFAALLYFVAYRLSGDRRTRQIVLMAILGVTALVTIHVWRQALDYGIDVYNETRRASGPFGANAAASNRAAAFFIVFLPVMLTAALYWRGKPWLRVFATLFTVLGVAGVFFTYSRQAYFAVAILFLFAALRRNWLLGIAIAALLLSYESWAPEAVIVRIQMTQQENVEGEIKFDESTESRFTLWKGATDIMADNPFGIGLNQFPRLIGQYVPEHAGLDAHNGYVRFATEAGFVGGLTMVVLLVSLFLLSRRVCKSDATIETQLVGNAFMLSVVGVVLCNLYGSRFFDADIMSAFWVLAGTSARHLSSIDEVGRSGRLPSALDRPSAGMTPVATPASS